MQLRNDIMYYRSVNAKSLRLYYVYDNIASMNQLLPGSIASTITHVPFISELLAQSEVFVTSKTFFGCLEKVGPKAFHPI